MREDSSSFSVTPATVARTHLAYLRQGTQRLHIQGRRMGKADLSGKLYQVHSFPLLDKCTVR